MKKLPKVTAKQGRARLQAVLEHIHAHPRQLKPGEKLHDLEKLANLFRGMECFTPEGTLNGEGRRIVARLVNRLMADLKAIENEQKQGGKK